MKMMQEFDKLMTHVTTKEGMAIAKEFRKRLKNAERYSERLNTYFSDTMDGMKPEDSARTLGLI